MRFTNVQCQCCKEKFIETDDVVVCPYCGTPHHRACYNENGRCINEEKHSEGFVWEFPTELKPKFEFPKRKAEMPEETQYKFKNGESAVTCPHCKTLNYGNDALCMKCKKPLGEKSEKVPKQFLPKNKSDRPLSQEEIEYEYFRRYGGLKPYIVIDGMSAKDMSTYIGKNQSGRYIRKYANMERYDRKFSVSLAAFFFGPVWFFYRKLFKEGLIITLIILLLSFARIAFLANEPFKEYIGEVASISKEIVESMNEQGIPLTDEAALQAEIEKHDEQFTAAAQKYNSSEISSFSNTLLVVSNVLDLILLCSPFVMSFLADPLYKKKMKKDIRTITRQYTEPEQFHAALKKKGGISVIGALLGIILCLAIPTVSMLPLMSYIQPIIDIIIK